MDFPHFPSTPPSQFFVPSLALNSSMIYLKTLQIISSFTNLALKCLLPEETGPSVVLQEKNCKDTYIEEVLSDSVKIY